MASDMGLDPQISKSPSRSWAGNEKYEDVPSKDITLVFGVIVPCLSIPIDPSLVITIQYKVLALDHESEGLVLEPEWDPVFDPELDVGCE